MQACPPVSLSWSVLVWTVRMSLWMFLLLPIPDQACYAVMIHSSLDCQGAGANPYHVWAVPGTAFHSVVVPTVSFSATLVLVPCPGFSLSVVVCSVVCCRMSIEDCFKVVKIGFPGIFFSFYGCEDGCIHFPEEVPLVSS